VCIQAHLLIFDHKEKCGQFVVGPCPAKRKKQANGTGAIHAATLTSEAWKGESIYRQQFLKVNPTQ
jgi:hypothetical protein